MKLAYFLTHPIQYQVPLIRHLRDGGVDVKVIYGSDAGSRSYFDPGFGRQVEWDVPLLEGYPHTVLNERQITGSRATQTAHYTTQISSLVGQEKFDAMWVHGWHHPMNVATWRVASAQKLPLMVRGETFLGCVNGNQIKRWLHRMVFTRRFRQVAAFLPVGTLNRQFYRAYGVPEHRLFDVPYAVDNLFFQQRATEASSQRETLRARLNLPEGRPIILFCGKLIDVKDPATLIQAVAGIVRSGDQPAPLLLMVGDGHLRHDLESLAAQLPHDTTRFLGFQNQTQLPALYDLCDLFVLPSKFEPWGLVVNEVMNAGKPVIVSDQVGSGPNLVEPGINGEIFEAGNVTELMSKLSRWLRDPELMRSGGLASLKKINQWGFPECLEGVQSALRSLTRSAPST